MKPRGALYAIVAVGLAVALAVGYLLGSANQRSASPETNASTSNDRAVAPAQGTTTQLKNLPAAEQTRRAFEAAFGESKSADRVVNVGDGQKEKVTYEPVRLFWTEFGPILLSGGSWPVGMCCVGYMSVSYLQPQGSTFRLEKQWLTAIPGSGNGNPPSEPMLSRKFSDLPVIYTESGFTHMGQTCGYFELTELGPSGPKYLGSFLNSQMSDDDSGIEAKFSRISHDGFELVFRGKGEPARKVTYVRRADGYVFAGPGEEPGC